MTLNFPKLILPVSLGRNQQLPQSTGDRRVGQGGQFSPCCPQLLGCIIEQQGQGWRTGLHEGAGQERVLLDASVVFQLLRYFAFFKPVDIQGSWEPSQADEGSKREMASRKEKLFYHVTTYSARIRKYFTPLCRI